MIELNKDIIKQIKSTYKPVAIYHVGSSRILDNPKDIDILIIYKTKEDLQKYYGKTRVKYTDEETQLRYEVFAKSIEDIESGYRVELMYEGGDFLHLVEGKDILDRSKFDVINNREFRAKVIKLLDSRFEYRKNFGEPQDFYTAKPYRLLMSCYILENNSYTLTEKQLVALNKVHDNREMTTKQWSYCEELIRKLADEIYKEEFEEEFKKMKEESSK